MNEPLSILGLTSSQFVELMSERGLSRPLALEMYRDFYRHGELNSSHLQTPKMPVVRQEHEGDTSKFIQRLDDGLETESVILPFTSKSGRLRNTLCVSSQVGCAMGCTFCETAQMGLKRNLSPEHIVGQWYAARHELGTSIDNIVFMGMGEPMDNLDSVLQSIEVLTDDNGPSIAPARITVSTVGRARGIRRLATLARRDGYGQLKLAVSINAPNDSVRSELMPINRAEPMAGLLEAMMDWTDEGKRRVLIEYVLIPGVNDRLEDADELQAWLGELNCLVNVIPYNPRRNSPWPAPDEALVERFTDRLINLGRLVTRRRTTGRSLMAACGQLGNELIRRNSAQ